MAACHVIRSLNMKKIILVELLSRYQYLEKSIAIEISDHINVSLMQGRSSKEQIVDSLRSLTLVDFSSFVEWAFAARQKGLDTKFEKELSDFNSNCEEEDYGDILCDAVNRHSRGDATSTESREHTMDMKFDEEFAKFNSYYDEEDYFEVLCDETTSRNCTRNAHEISIFDNVVKEDTRFTGKKIVEDVNVLRIIQNEIVINKKVHKESKKDTISRTKNNLIYKTSQFVLQKTFIRAVKHISKYKLEYERSDCKSGWDSPTWDRYARNDHCCRPQKQRQFPQRCELKLVNNTNNRFR